MIRFSLERHELLQVTAAVRYRLKKLRYEQRRGGYVPTEGKIDITQLRISALASAESRLSQAIADSDSEKDNSDE